MAGPPVIQPKAGAVKAPELSPYYSGGLTAPNVARVCTLHTLAALHIYIHVGGSAFLC